MRVCFYTFAKACSRWLNNNRPHMAGRRTYWQQVPGSSALSSAFVWLGALSSQRDAVETKGYDTATTPGGNPQKSFSVGHVRT